MPFTSDNLKDMAPIVDDDDLRQWGQFSDESLVDKYRKNAEKVKRASPPIDHGQKAVSKRLADHYTSLFKADDAPLLGDQMASNNWVVHGNHTNTGMPLFASDPHLGNSIPSAWLLYHLELPDGRIFSGAQLPGMPALGIGRSNDLVFGATTSRVDTSDLWKEKLNEDESAYLVDGEWRELKVITETIKVKGSEEPRILQVKLTHRGPLIPTDSLKFNSGLLFGGESPSLAPAMYSFAWQGGAFSGDDSFTLMQNLASARDLPTLFELFDSSEYDRYVGMGLNILFADTKGNIGYRLIMTIPERKDKTPFIGCRVLDGTTSEFDWTGRVIPQRDLPKSLNPKKGYLMTANGRQTSDNAINDYGVGTNSPGRTLRIDELLRQGVASGKKFTLDDMGAIQQDVVDVYARQVTPMIVTIVEEVMAGDDGALLTLQQKQDLEAMLNVLRNWRGSFDEESIGATVYTRWYIQFIRKLFTQYQASEDERMAYADNYHFTDAYMIIIESVLKEKKASRF